MGNYYSVLELGQSLKKGFGSLTNLTLRAGTVFLCSQSLVLYAHCTVTTFPDSTSLYLAEILFRAWGTARTAGAMGFRSMSGIENHEKSRKHLLYPEACLIALAPEHILDREWDPCPGIPGTVTVVSLSGRFITIKPCIHMPALPRSGVRKVISHSMLNSFQFAVLTSENRKEMVKKCDTRLCPKDQSL